MVVQPIRQNGQVQLLTTALKNICRDYPAGGTVLRELLQNADDAGATEVRFILDESTYSVGDPHKELLDPNLEQYQGPALLAYNNAIFTDLDFENLKCLGDSSKLRDGSTTGKFGRGFNSVYNWTDSPSIVSRNQLLILDPHCAWSSGGPVYDFVESFDDIAIQKHMCVFRTVMGHLDQKLDGTIIRIPLRTQTQVVGSKSSKISDRETTTSEILDVLRSFASEFGKNGLLFMRNIERLEIGSASMLIEIKLTDAEALRPHKLKINNAVKYALENPTYSFDHSFEFGIERRSAGGTTNTKFVVHHSIQCGLMDETLRAWAKVQNYIPWVAVAAQLPKQSSEVVNGSLFTVLPLPIATNQPVHIHGLFSVSPDRARLYQLSDNSAQDRDPANWNQWLLQSVVPAAWTKLLSCIADLYPEQLTFEKWPQSLHDARDPLSNALENVVAIIEKESLALWPTSVGYKTAKAALLGTGLEPIRLRNALREAQAPVVYVPDRLQPISQNVFKDRILCPQNLCTFLRSVRGHIKLWSDQTKHEILEYLLLKAGFTDYGGLDLFPFKDGTYRSIGESIAYVHRDSLEETLFCLEDFCNLDVDKLSQEARQALKYGCQFSKIHPSIRFRSASCLSKYCMSNIYKGVAKDQDFAVLDKEAAEFVTRVWEWISMRHIHILDQDISCLWLLPLSNGRHRKVKPKGFSQVYYAPPGEVNALMRRLNAKMSSKLFPLLDIGGSGLTMITESEGIMSTLWVQDAGRLVFLLQWLQRTWALVDHITDEERGLISKLVASQSPQGLIEPDRKAVAEALSHLSLFQKMSWKAVGDKMFVIHFRVLVSLSNGYREPVVTWTNLRCCSKTIGLLDDSNPVPQIDNVQFVSATRSNSSSQLLQFLGLDCLGSAQLIQDHIIPAWQSGKARNWTSSRKEQMAEFVLGHFSLLSLNFQARLREIPMVPISRLDGKDTSKFALAADLIDPSVAELKGLCFDDEEIFPKASFLRRFNSALKGCGLKTRVDESVVEHRIRCYASTNRSLQQIQMRAHELLKSACYWTTPSGSHAGSNLQRLKWLPVVDLSGTLSLKTSIECRGFRDRLLVSSQLPVLDMPISVEWERRLGWHKILPSCVLRSQLEFGVQTKDREVVDAVFSYISQNDLVDTLASNLTNISCVLVSSGMFVTPSQAFRPQRSIAGCDRLQPYLANVEHKFWQDHKYLLIKLKVGDQLQLTDLLKVQAILETKLPLEESDVAVAIEILNLASRFPRDSLTQLKVLSAAGQLCPIQDINYDDLGPLKPKEKVNITHPDIPRGTIKGLKIGGLREQLLKGILEIEDVDDEDEFDQRENATTRIANTLDRYPVETTFREYLANADDTEGATRISWLLDERVHPVDKLLTPDMRTFQGPAFLVHNDGVFSEGDFKGFKNVGEGSKAHDKATVGQFGQGAQTMYHWTDVPMILSGEWLLILDPQRKVLPRNQINGRCMAGVKIKLSRLRIACEDQLVPFEGLWGYTQSLNNYRGTIFRFPLRTTATSSGSALRNSKRVVDESEVCKLMKTYFHEARTSLLFLRRIKSIDFGIQSQPDFEWSITRLLHVDEDVDLFSKSVVCQITWKSIFGTQLTGKDKWWVAIEDLLPEADRLPASSRREMKNVECGIAALISSKFDSLSSPAAGPEASRPRMFSTLPLPTYSDLPVHIHATFWLFGDRQSIAIDDCGMESQGVGWNRYLLQEALPNLYLSFLDDILPQVRQRVFSFWPQEEPPKRSCAELLCASFWQKLPGSPQRLFPKAQPAVGAPQRRPPESLDISRAVFDFLYSSQSKTLAPLLMAMQVNLVRDIPIKITKHLKAVPEVKCVTGPMLRALFKSENGRTNLLKEVAQNPNILEVLFDLLIPVNAELHHLDGCHVLPLADGTLATLRLKNSIGAESPKYFVVSEDELKLFGFASRHLVKSSIGTMLEPVLDSGKFNLARLKLCDVKKLLEMKPAVSTRSAKEDRWLTEFWKYWNSNIDSSMPSSNIDTLKATIFGATSLRLNGTHLYSSPQLFHTLPAVVEPSSGEHKKLCDRIPDLWRFNPDLMPKSMADEEKSFYREASFYRFIRSLRLLSGQSGIGMFVKTHLDAANLKILRNLVIAHLSAEILSREPERFVGLGTDLKSIPLWPVFHGSSLDQLVSANDAWIAGDSRLLVPWMEDCSRFVLPSFSSDARNHDCLLKLGVIKVPIQVLLRAYVLPMPSTLSAIQWQYFQPLISAIAGIAIHSDTWTTGSLLPILTDSRVAADGNCKLTKTCEMYDHEDPIFISAFRHQKETRFLHKSVQGYRLFWLRLGLRHRANNSLSAGDYIQCLKVLKARLNAGDAQNDPHLEQDSRTVLSLLTSPNSNIQSFGGHWDAISRETVFRSRTNFGTEPQYRRDTMATLATEKEFLHLSDVILYEHVAICWTQTPFVVHQPTREVLGKLTSQGQAGHPDIDMVWQHLQTMKILSEDLEQDQIHDFLTDLDLTYEYLQDHLDSRDWYNVGNEAIWLNLGTSDHRTVQLEDIASSWQGIENLVLSSSCDAGKMKAVRPRLMRFEKLLRGMGCGSITYPTVTRPTLHLGCSVSKSLRQLRKDEKLLDITFSTEGRLIKAHKVVLGAASEKCAQQFDSRWRQEDIIKYDENTDPDDYMSYHTLSTMIDHAYEEEIDWKEMEVLVDDDEDEKAAKLDLLLDLHKGADCWIIPALMSQVEDKILVVARAFVNMSNVVEIRERAEMVGAKVFERWCAKYIKDNQHIVDKAQGGS